MTQRSDKPKTLAELRSRVSVDDRDLLDFCWASYSSSGKHPKIRDAYYKFEKPRVEDAVNRLGGSLIRRTWSSDTPGEEYHVTHLGALCSNDGPRLSGLVVRYVRALKKLYDANHETRGLRSPEFKPYLDATGAELGDGDMRDLGRLLVLGVRLVDASPVGPQPDGTWYINIGENIDDIRRVDDFTAFTDRELVKDFEANEPVTEIDRASKHPNLPIFAMGPNSSMTAGSEEAEDNNALSEKTAVTRLIEAMKNHPAVAFVLLMLPVAGGALGVANLWYSSVISEYRQKVEELSAELSKLRQELAQIRTPQTPERTGKQPHGK